MAKKSGRFKKDKFGIPDPLHFELLHSHRKLVELIYAIVIVGAIVSILILNIVSIQSVDQRNASSMLVLVLAIMLVVMFIERSMIAHRPQNAQRPAKSSS